MATVPNALSVLSSVASQYLAAQAATPAATLCDACHARPKYFDGTKTYSFCGRSCAAQMNGANGIAGGNLNRKSTTQGKVHGGAARGNMCDFCHKNPKFSDRKTTHQYCGKTCAQRAKVQGSAARPAAGSKTNANNGANSSGGGCLLCGKAAKKGAFCGKTCSDNAAPGILEVPVGHRTFTSVANQFKASWRHQTACPAVSRVYKVVMSRSSMAKYESYRASVEARGKFVAAGRSAGNENRRWHGTTRQCNLGDNGNSTLCNSTTCALCSIIQTSYSLRLFGKKTGWGRFGAGVYTSSTASKSNDYSNNTKPSNFKAVILNKVVVGKGYKMIQDNTNLTGPPAGYDSVLAEVHANGTLNYDELVCYNEDAIRPSYLVVYDA